MSRTKRGSGKHRRQGRAPSLDLPTALGGLLRTTLQQVSVVKDAVERQTRTSRDRLDEVVLQRKRRDTLARVGELVYEQAAQGRLDDLADHPELARLLAEVEDLEDQLAGAGDERHGEPEVVSSASWTPPGRRASARAHEEVRVWRPVLPETEDDSGGEAGEDDEARLAGPAAAEPAEATPWQSARRPRARSRRRQARASSQGQDQGQSRDRERGGIAFVTDAVDDTDGDLTEYMHADDLPARDEE